MCRVSPTTMRYTPASNTSAEVTSNEPISGSVTVV